MEQRIIYPTADEKYFVSVNNRKLIVSDGQNKVELSEAMIKLLYKNGLILLKQNKILDPNVFVANILRKSDGSVEVTNENGDNLLD